MNAKRTSFVYKIAAKDNEDSAVTKTKDALVGAASGLGLSKTIQYAPNLKEALVWQAKAIASDFLNFPALIAHKTKIALGPKVDRAAWKKEHPYINLTTDTKRHPLVKLRDILMYVKNGPYAVGDSLVDGPHQVNLGESSRFSEAVAGHEAGHIIDVPSARRMYERYGSPQDALKGKERVPSTYYAHPSKHS